MNQSLAKKLELAWEKRASYLKENSLEAFRLFMPGEIGLPLSVDLYKDNAVINIWEEIGERNWRETLESLLKERFGIESCFYKQRFRIEKRSMEIDSRTEKREVIEEYGNKFLVNLAEYLDTGLFLDHREARKLIGKMAKGKVVANLFAYTGAFSVYAALGGAKFTHTVDLSRTYLDWAKENFKLNGMAEETNWTYKMDCFEFYKYSSRKSLRFDLIVIDPPTFSKNKEKYFSVQKDHPQLIEEAAKLLNPGGEIFFSTNNLEFRMAPRIRSAFQIKNITNQTVPVDFYQPEKGLSQIHQSYLIRPRQF